MGRVVSRQQLVDECRRLREEGLRIVSTNGCFDLLHVGHTRYLQAARRLGDVLVVGINSDASVRGLKGPGRPIVREQDRAELVASLECVDLTTVFSQSTPTDLLAELRPDVHCKGGDYRPTDLPEACVVQSHGGRIEVLPLADAYSTSSIINRILKSHDGHES